jgi:RNA binding exosome subunit
MKKMVLTLVLLIVGVFSTQAFALEAPKDRMLEILNEFYPQKIAEYESMVIEREELKSNFISARDEHKSLMTSIVEQIKALRIDVKAKVENKEMTRLEAEVYFHSQLDLLGINLEEISSMRTSLKDLRETHKSIMDNYNLELKTLFSELKSLIELEDVELIQQKINEIFDLLNDKFSQKEIHFNEYLLIIE